MTAKVDMSGLINKFNNLKKVEQEVIKPAFDFFVKQTPVKTGNARNNTHLEQRNGEAVINADYPYAFVLDAGRSFRDGQMRGSEQAPKGMSDPTIKEIQKLVQNYINKHGNRG